MLLMYLVFHSSVSGPSSLMVRASDQYSEGLGLIEFKSQLDPGFFPSHPLSIINYIIKCTMPLTNINSNWMFNTSSGLCINLHYIIYLHGSSSSHLGVYNLQMLLARSVHVTTTSQSPSTPYMQWSVMVHMLHCATSCRSWPINW